ncbi:hypothetical protein H8D85_01190 [bacterium]|nr:hypothetical protein [bacterium]
MVKTVAFMPIRLNSTRIPKKSILKIKGRPMFCWSLQTLDNLGIPVHVYSSNNRLLKSLVDFEIKNIIFTARSQILDRDSTKGLDIYKSFSAQVPAEQYLLAHCTSPFVKLSSYKKLIETLKIYDSAATTIKYQTFVWYKNTPLNFTIPRPQTQGMEPIFIETSGAYAYKNHVLQHNSRSSLTKHKNIVVSTMESLDIDTPKDLEEVNDYIYK